MRIFCYENCDFKLLICKLMDRYFNEYFLQVMFLYFDYFSNLCCSSIGNFILIRKNCLMYYFIAILMFKMTKENLHTRVKLVKVS